MNAVIQIMRKFSIQPLIKDHLTTNKFPTV